MNARPRPATLRDCCTLNRSGRMLVHRWAPQEHYATFATSEGEPLRLSLQRCMRCNAFNLASCGGDRAALESILAGCVPVPPISAWISHEQPGHEHIARILPRRKRRKRSGYGRREAA